MMSRSVAPPAAAEVAMPWLAVAGKHVRVLADGRDRSPALVGRDSPRIDALHRASLSSKCSSVKGIPFERMYRDVISMPFHPRSFDDAEEALGKHALGIAPDVEPRWG